MHLPKFIGKVAKLVGREGCHVEASERMKRRIESETNRMPVRRVLRARTPAERDRAAAIPPSALEKVGSGQAAQ